MNRLFMPFLIVILILILYAASGGVEDCMRRQSA